MAIWFHYAEHISGAFYDHSPYIPRVWAQRGDNEKTGQLMKVNEATSDHENSVLYFAPL